MTFNFSTDEQLAGQRLMAGFSGTTLDDELKFLIGTLKVGGIILFACNIDTPNQLAELCRSAQEYAEACQQPPLLIAVDQEGGEVARLKEPFFTRFQGNPSMKSEEDAVHFARKTAKELHSVGINMNMAPVLDLNFPEIESIMRKRAFSGDPGRVSELGTAMINTFQGSRIMAVAKHFPGIGRTTLDSHLHLPVLETALKELEKSDLLPFKAAAEREVAGIMLSHIIYKDIDPEWPASLSPQVVKHILREKIGYEGVVITDDIDMKAIVWDIETVIKQIMASGTDIALICHRGPAIEQAFNTMLKITASSSESRTETLKSVKRITALKKKYLIGA